MNFAEKILSIIACKSNLTKDVFSLTPLKKEVFPRISSSMFNVVVVCMCACMM